jgi:hypothetical protein
MRSRVLFEDGGTNIVEPEEQSVEQEESQASLGMKYANHKRQLRSRKEIGWSSQKSNVGGNWMARLE